MKRKFTCFLIALFPLFLFAQHATYPVKVLYAEDAPTLVQGFKTNGCIDTLNEYQQRTDSFTIWGAGDGYTFGVGDNGQGGRYTDATGVHFDSVGTVTVEEVFVWIGAVKLFGQADILKIELYNAGADSMPFNLVGFGNANMAFVNPSLTVNFVNMTGLNRFSISAGSKQVASDFFVSLNYTAMNDTFGIVSGTQGFGFGENRTRQLLSNDFGGGWVRLKDFWNVNGAPLDVDIIMIPIVECVASATDPVFANEHFKVHPAYPNPTTGKANLQVELPHATELSLRLFDLNGRILYDSGTQPRGAGLHEFQLDLSDLAAGTYYYQVRTSESQVASRIVLGE